MFTISYTCCTLFTLVVHFLHLLYTFYTCCTLFTLVVHFLHLLYTFYTCCSLLTIVVLIANFRFSSSFHLCEDRYQWIGNMFYFYYSFLSCSNYHSYRICVELGRDAHQACLTYQRKLSYLQRNLILQKVPEDFYQHFERIEFITACMLPALSVA